MKTKRLKRGPFFTAFLSIFFLLPSSVYALRARATQQSPGVLKSLRSELRTPAAPYGSEEIPDSALQAIVREERRAITTVLGRPQSEPFPIYFYNLQFGTEDRSGEVMSAVLTSEVPLHQPLAIAEKKSSARGDVKIPLLSRTDEELLRRLRLEFRGVTDTERFNRLFNRVLREVADLNLERVPIRGILFFSEAGISNLEFEIDKKPYRIPKGVLFWTFKNGLLAVNVTLDENDVFSTQGQSVFAALALAVAQRPEAKVDEETLRSELRMIVEEASALRPNEPPVTNLNLPQIPQIERGASAKAGAALGIHPDVALIGGSDLFIETAPGLAWTLADLRHRPFVALADPNDPDSLAKARALNKQLKASGERPLPIATTPEEAIRLIRLQIEERDRQQGRGRASRPEIRAILSPKSPHAESLERQLKDAQVLVTALEKFLNFASQITHNLGLDLFVQEVQVNIINGLRTLRSA